MSAASGARPASRGIVGAMSLVASIPRRVALAAALAALLGGACAPSAPEGARSALLVTLDTTRADALTCLGGRAGLTPHLDALAAQGRLYTQARTSAPITLPAHASMLTGLYPIRHGARDNGRNPLPASATTLAELAAASGFQTAAFVSAAVLDAAYGLDQGFQTYVDPPRARQGSLSPEYVERPGEEVVADAVRWLKGRDASRPFLLWVHLFDAHAPYVPPPRFQARAGGDPYLGEVARVDAEVGVLLDALDELGLARETLVLVLGDHGEGRGDHGEATHGSFAYDATLHVPLIVRRPGDARAGEREDRVVSVVDVMPTVAAALGLRVPAGLDGVDLDAPGDDAGVYFETSYGFLHYGWAPISGWLEGGLKYVHDSDPQLFDVAADPREQRDVLARHPEAAARARKALASVAARPRLETADQADPALLASLRALGYATASAGGGEIPEPLDPSALPPARTRLDEVEAMARADREASAGRTAEAAELLAAVLADNPSNRTAAERRGTYLIAAGRCDEAEPIFEALIAEGTRTAEVYLNLGYCLQLNGRDDEAVERFLVAHELDPGNTSVLRNLVVVLTRLGRGADAARYQAELQAALAPAAGSR